MSYKYFHNSANRTVYKVDEPSMDEEKDSRGLRRGWYIKTSVLITRADNILIGSQWKYPTSEVPHKHFVGKRYSKEEVIIYFMGRVCTDYGSEISSEEYEKLQRQYETEARSNRPSS